MNVAMFREQVQKAHEEFDETVDAARASYRQRMREIHSEFLGEPYPDDIAVDEHPKRAH